VARGLPVNECQSDSDSKMEGPTVCRVEQNLETGCVNDDGEIGSRENVWCEICRLCGDAPEFAVDIGVWIGRHQGP